MTTIDLQPGSQTHATNVPTLAETRQQLEAAIETDLLGLPEQELCLDCAPDSDAEPGVPQDIIDTSIEVDVRTISGTGPEFLVQHLACGHQTCIPLRS